MITNLDKYIEVLEGREEDPYCYLYQKRTKEVEGCHARYHECKNCIKDTIKWLLEEYKGDILSDKEREYLKMVIAPCKDNITYVCKNFTSREPKQEVITVYRYVLLNKNSYEAYKTQVEFLQLPITKEMPFKMLEEDRMYDVRALGL